jgi:glycosyltransferase A (GT-A) superfamily protein (DUF2064 family)
MLRNDRAILVFARTPGCEAAHKPLGDVRGARRVHEMLLGRLRRALAKVGTRADVVLVLDGAASERRELAQRFRDEVSAPVHSLCQCGGSFGQRMQHAVAQAQELGARTLVIVGADSPELQADHIEEALRRADAGESVVGPSADGGFWLAAAPIERFDAIEGLPWETGRLVGSLGRRLGPYFALPVLADLDDVSDLANLADRLARSGDVLLARYLTALLSSATKVASEGRVLLRSLLAALPAEHRGPPTA